jgi:hypothetical protein
MIIYYVGDWVEVAYEYAPGTCSDGGGAFIMAIAEDDAGRKICTVSYILDKRIEKYVDQARITVTIMPFKDSTSANRNQRDVQQHEPDVLPDRVYEPPERSNLEWLEYGLKSRTHEKKGRLKEKLLKYGLMEATDEALWKRVMSDYKCQLAGIEGMRLALGATFKDPRETKGHNGQFGKFVTQKKDSQLDIPKNMWTIPYLLHAYGVKRSNFQNKRKADKKGATNLTQKMQLNRVQFNKGDCVITNRVASRRKYTAKYFFSRKKALDLTIPLAVTDHAADINEDEQLYRRKEWQLYSTRVRHYTT